MAKKDAFYKCEICGNIVSVLEGYAGQLVCCGKPMKEFPEQTLQEEKGEKHVPIIEKNRDKIKISVGEVLHPMEETHYIELIQLLDNGKVVLEKRLYPGENPIAEFNYSGENISAREFCNLHGLWKSK